MIGIDTETTLIPDRRIHQHGNQRVHLDPFTVPELVCVSLYSSEVGGELFDHEEGVDAVKGILEGTEPIALHNAPFDIRVLVEAGVPWDLWERALEEGRILDTKVLDMRARLAAGIFDKPLPPKWEMPRVEARSLKQLAWELLGWELDKDPGVRLGFGQYRGRLDMMPSKFAEYAIQDAEATYRIAEKLLALDGAPWDNAHEVRAEVAYFRLDQRGLRIDRAEARRLRRMFEKDIEPLRHTLVEHGLGEWEPLKGTRKDARHEYQAPPRFTPNLVKELADKGWHFEGPQFRKLRAFKTKYEYSIARPYFHLRQAVVRERLQVLVDNGAEHKLTETGQLSINADDWRDRIPDDDPALQTWLKHERLKKILTTYLDLYSEVDHVYPRIRVTGARSGRSSYSSPNVQNVSKRKHGIRSLFVPQPGHVFVIADYSQQELLTLAQAMGDLGIRGPLLEGIQARRDLHTQTAALLGAEPVTAAERQGAKAVNFGVPGGLGPAKLRDYARKVYGVQWTLDEAKATRGRYLDAYPDIAAYLRQCSTSYAAGLLEATGRRPSDWKFRLGLGKCSTWDLRCAMRVSQDPTVRGAFYAAERRGLVRLRTGFVRKGCSYTEGANTPFQGLAAAITKRAVWLAEKAGLRVVLVVHDELVAEIEVGKRKREGAIQREVDTLEGAMKQAFTDICPDTGPYAQVETTVSERWGKATGAQGEEV